MSDNVIQVTDQSFESEVLAADRAVLVDFWAEWCVPCHMVSPVVEELARDHAESLKAVKMNVDDNPETARRFAVMSIPTLIMFKDGQEKARVVGARGKEAILREIEAHLAAWRPPNPGSLVSKPRSTGKHLFPSSHQGGELRRPPVRWAQ
jgi:thioredoxin 1